jgi:hypothetical protein
MVRARGLEPLILAEPDPKSGVSAIPPRAHPNYEKLATASDLKFDFVPHFEGGKRKHRPAKATKRASNHKLPVSHRIHSGAQYHKVADGRKRPIRELWQRGSRFYARLAIEDLNTGRKEVRRVPFEGVQSVAQAQGQNTVNPLKRKDGTGMFVIVRNEIALQPGMAVWEAFHDPKDGKVKLDGENVIEFPKLTDFQQATLKVLRWEEKDKRFIIKDAELVP